MSLRLPDLGTSTRLARETGFSVLEAELVSEAAAALGRAGARAEAALARLNDEASLASEGREALLKAAAEAVWALFIQREACGMRDQKPVIADLGIPRAVLVRLGAR
jgi:hypothetical protein